LYFFSKDSILFECGGFGSAQPPVFFDGVLGFCWVLGCFSVVVASAPLSHRFFFDGVLGFCWVLGCFSVVVAERSRSHQRILWFPKLVNLFFYIFE